MIKKQQYDRAVQATLDMFAKAGIVITDAEKQRIEVADFGLSDLEHIGLEILTYVNTERVCAKEMVLFPGQTCPEHRHIDSAIAKGKEETFRVRMGKVYLYVEGEPAAKVQAKPIPSKTTVSHEIVLTASQQYTLHPNTKHWFQGGPEGAVVSEFSTRSTDETDVFTDEAIERAAKVE